MKGNFAKLTKLPSSFANLLEAIFFYGFGKNPRMPSNFSKLLKLLGAVFWNGSRLLIYSYFFTCQ